MSDVEWTNESVIRLIEEYRRRRELWDKNHDLYRVQTAKYEAWSSMSRIFDCDIADLRKKFNSILASHRREKAKIRSGGRSTWFLYSYLNFLSNHLEQPDDEIPTNHRTQESHVDADPTSDEQEEEEYQDHEDITVKNEPAEEYVQSSRLPRLKNSRRLTRTVKKKYVRDPSKAASANHIDSKLLEMLRLLRKSSEISKKKDECDSFGDYIAISLRKHDERTQSMIKQAINNILFEQEMKKYSAGQYTVVIAGDENPLILGEAETTSSRSSMEAKQFETELIYSTRFNHEINYYMENSFLILLDLYKNY